MCRVEGLQLLLYHQRVGVPDSDLKVLQRSFTRAPKQKSGNMTYDQVRPQCPPPSPLPAAPALSPLRVSPPCVCHRVSGALCALSAPQRGVHTGLATPFLSECGAIVCDPRSSVCAHGVSRSSPCCVA